MHFQYYQYGDTLPSIDTLCREFSVSAQTVTTALQRLREEGYIDMHNGETDKGPVQADRGRIWRLLSEGSSPSGWTPPLI